LNAGQEKIHENTTRATPRGALGGRGPSAKHINPKYSSVLGDQYSPFFGVEKKQQTTNTEALC